MSSIQSVEIFQRISALGVPAVPSLAAHAPTDNRTPEQRLAEAASRFHKRGCTADDARRRLGVYNAMMLDGAVSPEVFERIFHAEYPLDDKSGTQGLPLVSFSTIMREDLPPVEWDVESVIARGDRVMFYGEWSSLKSWVALDLALHLAAGTAWLGKFAIPHPRRVLYIDEEMNPRTLRRRIKRLGLGMHLNTDDIPFQALSRYGVTLDAKGVLRLSEGLNACAFKPDVIVIDTMRRVLVGSENEAEDITRFWKVVDTLVKQDTTVIVLHHMRKRRTKKEKARDRASGTTDLPAGADDNVSVERHPKPDQDAVTLGFEKSREGEEAEDCVVRLNDGGENNGPVSFDYEGTPKEYATTVKQGAGRGSALADFVQERGTATTADIIGHVMEKFGVSEKTAKRDLKAAVKAGRVVPVPGSPRGAYTVPA